MNILYSAHSGLRYLVLLAGIVAAVVMLRGWSAGAPFSRASRATGAAFAGLLHLQVVLGLAVAALGLWYPAVAGHLTMMVLAAVAVPVGLRLARRHPDGRGAHLRGAGAVLLGLALIVGGIAAIGRGMLEHRAPGSPQGSRTGDAAASDGG